MYIFKGHNINVWRFSNIPDANLRYYNYLTFNTVAILFIKLLHY